MPGSKKSRRGGVRGFIRGPASSNPHDYDRKERYDAMIARMKQRLEKKKKEKAD